jgi:hypothetical protein
MPKLLIYGVGAFFSTLVLIFVVTFLIDINRVPASLDPLQEIKQPKDINQATSRGKQWLHKFDKERTDDYYYPVTEISIDLDLDQNVDHKYRHRVRHFRLETQALSDYHYFCLRQVLDQSRIKHKIERFNNDVAVILYSQDHKALRSIVKELNKYDIASSVKEIH